MLVVVNIVGRHGIVSIATQNSLGINSWWEWDILYPSRQPRGPPSLLYNMYQVIPRGKAASAWRWPPTLSSAEVKKSRAVLPDVQGGEY